MARESQGLQVLLIGAVMLSVALGVSLYLYVKEASTVRKAAATEKLACQQIESEKKATEEETRVLKTLIGFPEKSTAEIKKQFDEDMQTYGIEKKSDAAGDATSAGKLLFDASTLHYSRLLAEMYKVVQDRTAELIQAKASLANLQAKFKNREVASNQEMNELLSGYGKLDDLVKKISGGYQSGEHATEAEMAELVKQTTAVKRNAMEAVAKAADNEKVVKKELQDKDREITELVEKIRKLERPEVMDLPAGEITAVSLATKSVLINRGRADALQPQTKFTVYSADSTGQAKAVKKGTIEVTQIDGEHSAQARILDDKIADPLMVGDKLFTRFWSPGQRIHFALAGIMNLGGDGHNQLTVVRETIVHNGGTVDCWLDEEGHKQGQITADTRYIVVGDPPGSGVSDSRKNYDEILRDAERYQVRKMTLGDFKQRMGD